MRTCTERVPAAGHGGPSGVGQRGCFKLSKQGSSGYSWRRGEGRCTSQQRDLGRCRGQLQAMGCSLAVPPPKHTTLMGVSHLSKPQSSYLHKRGPG